MERKNTTDYARQVADKTCKLVGMTKRRLMNAFNNYVERRKGYGSPIKFELKRNGLPSVWKLASKKEKITYAELDSKTFMMLDDKEMILIMETDTATEMTEELKDVIEKKLQLHVNKNYFIEGKKILKDRGRVVVGNILITRGKIQVSLYFDSHKIDRSKGGDNFISKLMEFYENVINECTRIMEIAVNENAKLNGLPLVKKVLRIDIEDLFYQQIKLDDIDNKFNETMKLLKPKAGSRNGVYQEETTAKIDRIKRKQSDIDDVKFEDIVGLDKVKDEFLTIIDQYKDSRKYEELGLDIQKGVIMHGKPGTGKTMIAKALTNSMNIPFLYVKTSDILEKWVGSSQKNMSLILEKANEFAKEHGYCVLFIDEIESIARQRYNDVNDHSTRIDVLNLLLQFMDGLKKNAGVIVIGATNNVEIIDSAFRSRSKVLEVNLPDEDGLTKLWNMYLLSRNIHVDDLDINKVVKLSLEKELSGRDVRNISQDIMRMKVKEIDNVEFQNIKEYIRKNCPVTTEYLIEKISKFEENSDLNKSKPRIGFNAR